DVDIRDPLSFPTRRSSDLERAAAGNAGAGNDKAPLDSGALRTLSGGEGGIRTLDTVSRIHAFQACSFNHSDTSPDPVRGVHPVEDRKSTRLNSSHVKISYA